MSASNWSICPRCWADAEAKYWDEEERVNNLYGLVTLEEFEAAVRVLDSMEPDERSFEHCFRQDYEWYIKDGTAVGYFRGQCTDCGLSVEIDVEKEFYGNS